MVSMIKIMVPLYFPSFYYMWLSSHKFWCHTWKIYYWSDSSTNLVFWIFFTNIYQLKKKIYFLLVQNAFYSVLSTWKKSKQIFHNIFWKKNVANQTNIDSKKSRIFLSIIQAIVLTVHMPLQPAFDYNPRILGPNFLV